MIRIQQIKLRPDHTEADLRKQISKKLRLPEKEKFSYEIVRQSVDARKKPEIFFVYTLDVSCRMEAQILKKLKNDKNVSVFVKEKYAFPEAGDNAEKLQYPPVIVGAGPAGLFCALMLARAGYAPILLERGDSVSERTKKVQAFWKGAALDPESNVQFGEGGAGTFSDGKLNTMIKDPTGRIRFVLENFVSAGADKDILYSYKPHIGTDVLETVVRNIREEIIALGGKVCFRHRLNEFSKNDNGLYELSVSAMDSTGETKRIIMNTAVLVLALGHSARDTFQMLREHNMKMHAKAFAVGVRVIHPQKMINESMYGDNCPYEMDAAPYKVTGSFECGNAYSFCMCPGGYVVNASSEEGHLAVNGMSYHDRGGECANSAIVVSIAPEEYCSCVSGADHADPLCGLAFQRSLEKNAYDAGMGKIPVQTYEDYAADRPTDALPDTAGSIRGLCAPADVRNIFPKRIAECIDRGIEAFDHKIHGFASPDTLLCGVESRTSSPVRLERGDDCVSLSHPGIYPCGEGAGYAGGITSAAVDGIRVAEKIVSAYLPGQYLH